ncbi:MAG: hypothetical protein HOP12_10805 [Candidatus Eisenbacteria bacterium]|uniref:Glycosyltransferase RgtA/B/C/D-like domain-containing protein n=1 Tax=Eiseniibacteriota bacterium TaxID=2212470 RepID=A0A849SGY5_UNCEI|nr:hypothetical protein [Candidatus Eisenbacteria bacterium]
MTRREWAFVAVVLLAAAGLRVWEASRAPLWFDEIYTLWVARMSWPELTRALAIDIHPPLHYAIIKLWRGAFGEGDVALRASSVVAGVASIAVAMGFARDAFGKRAAGIVGVLLAVHTTHLSLSQDLRFYPWLSLWVWLAVFAAWRWVTFGLARDAVLLIAAEACGLYTQYLSALAFAVIFAWGLFVLWSDPRRARLWLGLHVATALLFAPLLATFVAQVMRNSETHWIRRPHPEHLLDLARRMSFGALYLVPVVAACVAAAFTRREHRGVAMLIVIVLVIPTLVTLSLTVMGAHLFTVRYQYYLIPGLCLLVAAGLSHAKWRMLSSAVTLLLIVAAARLVIIRPPNQESSRILEARAVLFERALPGEAILCADTHTLLALRHYGAPSPPRLVWRAGPMPYYEGTAVIDPSWVLRGEQLHAYSVSEAPFWMVRLRHGGVSSLRTAGWAYSIGARVVWERDSLTVWHRD